MRAAHVTSSLAIVWAACLTAGCAQFPEVGPSARDITSQTQPKKQSDYVLVPVTPQVLASLAAESKPSLRVFADNAPAPVQLIGIGDSVSVMIWDVGGLFNGFNLGASASAAATANPSVLSSSQIQGSSTTVPVQNVDQSGFITIPYAGRLRAAGKTTGELEKDVQEALRGKTIGAQAVVTVGQNQSSQVTVTGDVNHPGRLMLPLGGVRLLDAIALSGGATAPASDVAVQVTRGNLTRRVRLDSIVREPAENIYLHADDLVVLDREPQSVVVLGATNHNAQVQFGKADLTLAEAVGNGGGLTDIQADPSGVFVFRYADPATAKSLQPEAVLPTGQRDIPVVFQIDMKKLSGFFAAEAFRVHDRDVIYVANSPVVQLGKIAHLLSTVASVFNRSAVSTGN